MARSEMNVSMPSTTRHDFSRVPHADIPRSVFNRSHGHKTTADAGFIFPIYVDEALPGDTITLKMSGFGRLATPIHPTMDNLYITTFFFSVPLRLVWDNFKKFMGEQTNPGDSTDYVVPTYSAPSGGFTELSLEDYMGIPTKVENVKISAFWARAYNLIYNEWFRDENLINSLPVPKDDGPDDPTSYKLQKRGKRHDYFTASLPWPQKGPSVPIPVGGIAPITGIGATSDFPSAPQRTVTETGPKQVEYPSGEHVNTNLADQIWIRQDPNNANAPYIFADLSQATAASVNDLRLAFQMQRFGERDARGGTRYTEKIRAHFNVTSPDARQQRPQYRGGGRSPIIINPVAQTSETQSGGQTPQGNLAAIGTVGVRNHGFTCSFTEHEVILGLACITADLTYQQGVNRMFLRETVYDYYWPVFSHLGEQAVQSREIFADGTGDPDANTGDFSTFGYQERHAEYRYKPSQITGRFRSNATQSLDSWHLAQSFATRPTLSQQFIEEDPPVDRIIAVQSEPHVIMDLFFDIRSARPMPTYSIPGLIDHF